MPDPRETTEQAGSFRDFLGVLFRRKWVVLTTLGVTLASVIYLALTSVSAYESYSKLLVNRGHPVTAFGPGEQMLSWEEDLTSEMEIIESARICDRAQEFLVQQGVQGEDDAPYEINPQEIRTTTSGKSSVIRVYYRCPIPIVAESVVRVLTQAYREFRTHERTPDPTAYLQQEIEGVREEIGHWENKRAEFLVNEGTVQLREERTNLLIGRRGIENDLARTRGLVAEQQAQTEWMQQMAESDEDTDPTASIYPIGEVSHRGEPALLVLRRTILSTEAEYIAAKAQYTEGHPRVLALRDRLDEFRIAIREEAAGYAKYLGAVVEASRAKEASLEASLDYINETLSAFPSREAQLAHMDRTIEALQTTHDALLKRRLDALATQVGSNPWDVVVLEDAVEAYPVRTRDYARMSVIPLFALLVGIALAFLVDGLDHSVKSRAEIEAHLKIPVLATVSRFRK
ncbi:MAG: hypothetical protein KAY24_11455 [Candidatus Eisenbacteria sp.]|nr:hypothetical protein [Candidatus Eisenbacteria bacterium]